MCCAWNAIGTISISDTGQNWIAEFTGQKPEYIYFSAYHWALSQITLGSNDVNPVNSYERTFCILLNVFGLLYSSTIVSIVSAQAMEYVTVRRERMEDMTYLTKFLEQHRVNSRLANRVRRQANDRCNFKHIMIS